ncbi:Hypothetical protein NTJ_09159 [Nesidiocoris tenuis]|uniref:Secreted protein n=1 Tax=Nesidiocoris tenuis TaxID=355587 RepID=A0ABN7AWG1_9HEMI|nr:Hypothetical protein NTJ_09159 [Nesidiocoris tenuis]
MRSLLSAVPLLLNLALVTPQGSLHPSSLEATEVVSCPEQKNSQHLFSRSERCGVRSQQFLRLTGDGATRLRTSPNDSANHVNRCSQSCSRLKIARR